MAKKVLVVDDDPPIVRLVQVNLEREGYEVITAFDGKEALEKVDAENPSLVVLDRLMPDMDGIEVLKNLRRNPVTRELPVIIEVLEALRRIQYQEKDLTLQYIFPDTRTLCETVLNEEDAQARQGARTLLNWLDG